MGVPDRPQEVSSMKTSGRKVLAVVLVVGCIAASIDGSAAAQPVVRSEVWAARASTHCSPIFAAGRHWGDARGLARHRAERVRSRPGRDPPRQGVHDQGGDVGPLRYGRIDRGPNVHNSVSSPRSTTTRCSAATSTSTRRAGRHRTSSPTACRTRRPRRSPPTRPSRSGSGPTSPRRRPAASTAARSRSRPIAAP